MDEVHPLFAGPSRPSKLRTCDFHSYADYYTAATFILKTRYPNLLRGFYRAPNDLIRASFYTKMSFSQCYLACVYLLKEIIPASISWLLIVKYWV